MIIWITENLGYEGHSRWINGRGWVTEYCKIIRTGDVFTHRCPEKYDTKNDVLKAIEDEKDNYSGNSKRA